MRESILEKIIKARENAPHKTTDEELKAKIAGLPPCRDFAAAFKGDGIHVIAELKKASPSKGLIRPDFQPVELAKALNLPEPPHSRSSPNRIASSALSGISKRYASMYPSRSSARTS